MSNSTSKIIYTLTDEAPAPDVIHQLFLGHHPLAPLDEVDEHVKGLWLQPHHGTMATQLEPIGVQVAVAELVTHGTTISCHPRRSVGTT